MKNLFWILFFYSLSVNAQKICAKEKIVATQNLVLCNPNDWQLVFEDDFNGNQLDLNIWQTRPWAQGAYYGNNGTTQEFNTLENAIVENGVLKIITDKKLLQAKAVSWKPDSVILEDGLPNLRQYNYTSANLWTKKAFEYGKFEARVKVPKGKGLWPAFWLYGGAHWNEIDIFEFWNETNFLGIFSPKKLSKIHHMNAWLDYNQEGIGKHCEAKYKDEDFSNDFHVFTLVWEKNKMEWLVDGELKYIVYQYYTNKLEPVECEIFSGTEYIFNKIFPHQPLSIIFNTAVQTKRNAPNASTPFPSVMEIDWVRCYQKTK